MPLPQSQPATPLLFRALFQCLAHGFSRFTCPDEFSALSDFGHAFRRSLFRHFAGNLGRHQLVHALCDQSIAGRRQFGAALGGRFRDGLAELAFSYFLLAHLFDVLAQFLDRSGQGARAGEAQQLIECDLLQAHAALFQELGQHRKVQYARTSLTVPLV